MSFENLLLERDGAVAVLTSSGSHGLNALNSSTVNQLGRGLLDLRHDAAVRADIIAGR